MDDFFDDLQRRDERRRTETINGKEYTAQCTDPYGLWHIVDCRVAELDGTYTSIEALWQAIRSYEAKQNLINGVTKTVPKKDVEVEARSETSKPSYTKRKVNISELGDLKL